MNQLYLRYYLEKKGFIFFVDIFMEFGVDDMELYWKLLQQWKHSVVAIALETIAEFLSLILAFIWEKKFVVIIEIKICFSLLLLQLYLD